MLDLHCFEGFLQLWQVGATLELRLLTAAASPASLIVERKPLVAAACGSALAAPGLWSTGSVLVAHRLHCSEACGTFPD